MKKTIDIPKHLYVRAELAADRNGCTISQLISDGLEMVVDQKEVDVAIQRLNRGYSLGGDYLDRNSSHDRQALK